VDPPLSRVGGGALIGKYMKYFPINSPPYRRVGGGELIGKYFKYFSINAPSSHPL